jgi:hypothetical protein
MVDKAMDLKFVGGVFGGNIKPTPFLCLVSEITEKSGRQQSEVGRLLGEANIK